MYLLWDCVSLVHGSLLTVQCSLLTLTTHSLLHAARCSLPTAHCYLPPLLRLRRNSESGDGAAPAISFEVTIPFETPERIRRLVEAGLPRNSPSPDLLRRLRTGNSSGSVGNPMCTSLAAADISVSNRPSASDDMLPGVSPSAGAVMPPGVEPPSPAPAPAGQVYRA